MSWSCVGDLPTFSGYSRFSVVFSLVIYKNTYFGFLSYQKIQHQQEFCPGRNPIIMKIPNTNRFYKKLKALLSRRSFSPLYHITSCPTAFVRSEQVKRFLGINTKGRAGVLPPSISHHFISLDQELLKAIKKNIWSILYICLMTSFSVWKMQQLLVTITQ